LFEVLDSWVRDHPGWAYRQQGWTTVARSATEVADLPLTESDLLAVDLATWLNGPDGQLITAVVEWVLPGPQHAQVQLLVSAVTLVAEARQRQQRAVASRVAVGVLVGALLVVLFRGVYQVARVPNTDNGVWVTAESAF
jgi:hypothetical protein